MREKTEKTGVEVATGFAYQLQQKAGTKRREERLSALRRLTDLQPT